MGLCCLLEKFFGVEVHQYSSMLDVGVGHSFVLMVDKN